MAASSISRTVETVPLWRPATTKFLALQLADELRRSHWLLGALERHREGDHGVDLRRPLALVEPPPARGLPRDRLRDVRVQRRVVRMRRRRSTTAA